MEFGLDIIIPTYKDVEGLRRTLKSVYYPQYKDFLTITVIDDCSPEPYDEVEAEYPDITFHHLKKNRGPGFARQYGLEHTSRPYILFLDCGDILISKYSTLEIKDLAEENPTYLLFLFTWISDKTGKISTKLMRSTQGWVYKRELFNLYDIEFCTDKVGGYADEDVGFNHICTTIVKHMELRDHEQYSRFCSIPIYKKINDPNSITNQCHYFLTKQIPGLSINAAHVMNILARNNLDKIDRDTFIDELNMLLFSLYKDFADCATRGCDLLQEHWTSIRKFYFDVYKQYESWPENETYILQNIGRYLEKIRKFVPRPNIRRFIHQLNDYELCPQEYYDLRSD